MNPQTEILEHPASNFLADVKGVQVYTLYRACSRVVGREQVRMWLEALYSLP